MTLEEIKRAYSMRDVVQKYGVKVRRDGMACCPIHGERRPSMKVYEDSFHCFACGANGDIFSFVQQIDHCDFKTAYQILGGTYEKPTRESRLELYRIQKEKQKKEQNKQKRKALRRANDMMIHATRELFKRQEPLTEDWWHYMDLYHSAIIKDINLEMEGGGNS